MAGKFEFLKDVRPGAVAVESAPVVPEAPPPRLGRPPGKRSNPVYRSITIILQKDTIRQARRKLEDGGSDQDLSELLQHLLASWVGAK